MWQVEVIIRLFTLGSNSEKTLSNNQPCFLRDNFIFAND